MAKNKSLFEFIDCLFDREKYKDCTNQEKRNYFFQTQRFVSKHYPDITQLYNHIEINKEAVCDLWHKYLTKKYTRKPDWTYISAVVSKKDKKDIFDKIDSETIEYYLKHNNCDQRDFDFIKELYPEETLTELKSLQKFLKEAS